MGFSDTEIKAEIGITFSCLIKMVVSCQRRNFQLQSYLVEAYNFLNDLHIFRICIYIYICNATYELFSPSSLTQYIYIYIYIGMMIRVFSNGPGGLDSIPGRVIPNTKIKWYMMLPCLTLGIIRQGSRVKWSNPGTSVAPSPIPWCSSYRKGSLRVTLDNGHQLYIYIYIYIYIYFMVVSLALDFMLNAFIRFYI